MTKLPSDAFLPSGGFDSKMSAQMAHPSSNGHQAAPGQHPSSRTSPTGHARSQFNRPHAPSFPTSTYPFQPIHDYNLTQQNPNALGISPSASPRSAAAPTFTYPYATSQHLLEASFPSARRSNSLSPTNISVARPSGSSMPREPHDAQQPAVSPCLGVATSLSRSVSADAAAPQQTSLHLVQRLAQQNSLIREAWEAERTYLEANRKRAEEVYQEERAIMEDLREDWINEKADMQREMQALCERIHRIEGENAALKSVVSPGSHYSGMVSPRLGHTSGQRDTSELTSLPPGLEGAARRPHFANVGGSRTSPTGQAEGHATVPLDPRTQPETSPSRDFLASPDKETEASIPLIDVQEIDPTLDGIFVKANAVQRPTFAEASAKSTPGTSPPAGEDGHSEQKEPTIKRRTSSKAQTMQALAAGEIRRRTMHAGHTPNHSLSLFPTMTSLDRSDTTQQSEATTPTATSAPPEQREYAIGEDSTGEETEGDNLAEPDPSADNSDSDRPNAHMEPQLEPVDDVPLTGPLMVKNIPAQDEIFWAQVNKKLEPISNGQNALPAVMRGEQGYQASIERPDQPRFGSDGAQDLPQESDGKKAVEADVPLKMRSTTNFGAPFGAM